MKLRDFAIAIILVMVCTLKIGYTEESSIRFCMLDDLISGLGQLKSTPETLQLRSMRGITKKFECTAIKNTLDECRQSAGDANISITVLLSAHEKIEMDERQRTEVSNSQTEMARQLAEGSFNVVGIEGETMDPFSIESYRILLTKDAIGRQDRKGKSYGFDNLPSEAIDEELSLRGGPLKFFYDNPDYSACVFGYEFLSLHQIQSMTIGLFLSGYPDQKGILFSLHECVSSLRSQVALAKTLIKLQGQPPHKRKAAIVIGDHHGTAIIEMAKQLKIRAVSIKTF